MDDMGLANDEDEDEGMGDDHMAAQIDKYGNWMYEWNKKYFLKALTQFDSDFS